VSDDSPWPVVAAAVVGIQVGSAIVASRFAVEQIGPISLALLRYTIGFLCLLPPALMSGRLRFARRDLLPIALLGIVQFGVVVALLNLVLQTLPSARVALLFATFPLMTMLIAASLGHELLTTRKTAGVVLTLVAVAIALGEKAFAPSAEDEWVASLLVLGSALAGALCAVLSRPFVRRYDALSVGAFAMLATVGALAVMAAGEGFFDAPPSLSLGAWGAVAFIGVSSGAGYFLWLWALRHTTPTRVTVFLALSPITAAILGTILLGEPMTWELAAAISVLTIGLWLALRSPA